MSEASIITQITNAATLRPGTSLGIGDDAAVLDPDGSVVLAHDLLVDGVHFRQPADSGDLGWKALAVNLSDIAAMGAEPVAALVGLVLPGPKALDIEAFYEGMDELAAGTGVTIAGGDLSQGDLLVIAVTAVGRLAEDKAPLIRAGATPGDQLLVTGPLGASEAGRLLLEQPDAARYFSSDVLDPLRQAHARPTPEFAASRALRAEGASAVMDCSDGLIIDAGRLAEASGCAATVELESLPIAEGVADVAAAMGRSADAFAATAGEDYRLLAAVDPTKVAATLRAVPGAAVVGRFGEGSGVTAVRGGDSVHLGPGGYTHRV